MEPLCRWSPRAVAVTEQRGWGIRGHARLHATAPATPHNKLGRQKLPAQQMHPEPTQRNCGLGTSPGRKTGAGIYPPTPFLSLSSADQSLPHRDFAPLHLRCTTGPLCCSDEVPSSASRCLIQVQRREEARNLGQEAGMTGGTVNPSAWPQISHTSFKHCF
jgi:hypothetical protein